ncbi:MAG: hypothetical protein HJJLKODD_02255 [Phycisphaerae bacterium]|nr:hypothetical protein [Phycisphaerae bacterium]
MHKFKSNWSLWLVSVLCLVSGVGCTLDNFWAVQADNVGTAAVSGIAISLLNAVWGSISGGLAI